MKNEKRKQIFVHYKIRKYFLAKGENINISKYCILDIIRRFSKSDTGTFEYKQEFICSWLNIEKSTVSEHLKYLRTNLDLLEKNEFGIRLTDKFPFQLYDDLNARPHFVIIDIEIKKEIENDYGFLTFEQFAVLTTVFTMQLNRFRKISYSYLSRALIIDRKTVKKAILILLQAGLLQQEKATLKLSEEGEMYFEPLRMPVGSFPKVFGE